MLPPPVEFAVVFALLCALATGAGTIPVLLRLPEPDNGPCYARLATPGMAAAVGWASLLASMLVVNGTSPTLWLAWAALTTVCTLACAIDARTTWLPLPLARAGWLIAAIGAVVAAVTASSPWPLLIAAAGALALGGLFHLLWRFTGAFGYGDVRLAATIGAVTALDSVALVAWSLLLGTAAGAVIGIVHRLTGRTGAFPYGPGLWAGPFLALLLRATWG